MKKFKSSLVVLSAPSGGGKTSIARELVRINKNLIISVSATTRAKRPKEKEGVDYFFLTEEEFKKQISLGNFLEYEQVHGNFYGTLKKTVDDFIRDNKIVIFDIDVNGALSIKKEYPDAILIFIKAPSDEELIRRLKGRKSESKELIEQRLKRLPFEYEQSLKFDHIIINESFYQSVDEINRIIMNKN